MRGRRLALVITGVVGVGAVVAALALVAWAWYESRLPGTYNVMDYGTLDYGGGSRPGSTAHHALGHGGGPGAVSVSDLRGPRAGSPDARFTLTARRATVRLTSGRAVDALTFDGRLPGPELRVRQGDLVEVTLRNVDIAVGVSIHWHGVDVPNGEDGVAGVTQDAVGPGERFVYRFRAEQVGTFWYHTHQSAAKEVKRGLYGAFVIEPGERSATDSLDLTLIAHDFAGISALNRNDGIERRAVPVGTPVRLRLVNSNSTPEELAVDGTPFRVVAIDGTELHGSTPLEGRALRLAGGGRFDVAFTMPANPVRVGVVGAEAALALSENGREVLAAAPRPGPEFDPAVYGTPAPTPFAAGSTFDREFRFEIDRKPGFFDGRPGMHWAINGGIYPNVPVFVVEEGDLVRVTIVNDTDAVHPMHLHGHHMLVLSRDGTPVSGSPWWSDTLDVEPGEAYEVGFRADNPGLWMDHCHNLRHSAEGLTMHVAYAGVTTPFTAGGAARNDPE